MFFLRRSSCNHYQRISHGLSTRIENRFARLLASSGRVNPKQLHHAAPSTSSKYQKSKKETDSNSVGHGVDVRMNSFECVNYNSFNNLNYAQSLRGFPFQTAICNKLKRLHFDFPSIHDPKNSCPKRVCLNPWKPFWGSMEQFSCRSLVSLIGT